MKVNLGNKSAHVLIKHMDTQEFMQKHPAIAENSCLTRDTQTSRITVAQVTFENLTSTGVAYCHPNDQFKRRSGSSRSLSKAMNQHPALQGYSGKQLRRSLYESVFRKSESPYKELLKMIKGRPELTKKLVESGRKILAETILN